jgi:hypothetical protein
MLKILFNLNDKIKINNRERFLLHLFLQLQCVNLAAPF